MFLKETSIKQRPCRCFFPFGLKQFDSFKAHQNAMTTSYRNDFFKLFGNGTFHQDQTFRISMKSSSKLPW